MKKFLGTVMLVYIVLFSIILGCSDKIERNDVPGVYSCNTMSISVTTFSDISDSILIKLLGDKTAQLQKEWTGLLLFRDADGESSFGLWGFTDIEAPSYENGQVIKIQWVSVTPVTKIFMPNGDYVISASGFGMRNLPLPIPSTSPGGIPKMAQFYLKKKF